MSRMRPVNGHQQRAQDPGGDPGQEGAYLERPRVAAARRRARIAKGALAALGAFGFGAWMVLARTTYAGHPKQAVHSLAIPQPLYEVVRRNLLQAGILAPATAPPDATTSTS